jgi:dTMP kinase
MIERGKYIVFEGGDYAGKSTQAALLAKSLGAIATREPGGDVFGLVIRGILLDTATHISPTTDMLMHAAARAELMETTVRPTLKSGQHVVSDRSWISSAAYQGSKGVPFRSIESVNRIAIGELLQPDLLLLLDADPAALLSRRTGPPDRMESMDLASHVKIRNRFLELADSVNAVTIDALQPMYEIQAIIRDTVKERLAL